MNPSVIDRKECSFAQPEFYEALLPLIQLLIPADEIPLDEVWMKLDGIQDMVLVALVFRLEERLDELARLKAEIEMCRRHPIIVERQPDPGVSLPQTPWMDAWRAKPGFETQSSLLCIIGETGLGRLPSIREQAAAEFGYSSPNAGGISKAIQALHQLGFIVICQAEKGMQGRPPKLVWLTDLGQAAYIMLSGQQPVKSELSSHASHVSDAHMLLNLEAEDWLKQAGYEILARAHRHYLDGKRQAVPDLTVLKNGQIFYVEVERSGKKSSRPEKWINMCELSGGEIYIFCQNQTSKDQIAEEVQDALTERGLSCCLHLTNLDALKSGQRGPDGDIWLGKITFWR